MSPYYADHDVLHKTSTSKAGTPIVDAGDYKIKELENIAPSDNYSKKEPNAGMFIRSIDELNQQGIQPYIRKCSS
jgi:hypothetical protein